MQSASLIQIAEFFRERLGDRVYVLANPSEGVASDVPRALKLESSDEWIASCQSLIALATENSDLESISVGVECTLSVACVEDADGASCILVAVCEAPQAATERLIRSAIESYKLSDEIRNCRFALEESAIQLAQSFEEQHWIRGFARNAASFTNAAHANDIADGILEPLGYLLRSESLYLIVDCEEQSRSDLNSQQYGNSKIGIKDIQFVLEQLGVLNSGQPFVRNQAALQCGHGAIDSLIAVPVITGRTVGVLAAINRLSDPNLGHLPIYDPEFGSVEVGLMEEAGVLLATQTQNLNLLRQSQQLVIGTLHAMSNAIDARDRYTQGHSERVARLSAELATLYGMQTETVQEIYLTGILHDIGKIGVPDAVLLKNGPLTNEEFKIIQQHPEIGYRIVEQLGQLQFVLPGILYHHERWDGKGYPHGLAGEDIPMIARVMAVADAFDAMTSSRPYRQAMPVTKARSIITGGRNTQWDAEVVDCFEVWLHDRIQNLTPEQVQPSDGAQHQLIPQGAIVEKMMEAVAGLSC